MKAAVAVLVLLCACSQAFLVPPSSLTSRFGMHTIRSAYMGFLDGIGAAQFNIEIGEKCFGAGNAEQVTTLLEEFKTLNFDSRLMDLVPFFQAGMALFYDLHTDCNVHELKRHIYTHSQLESLPDFAMNLMKEMHHFEHAVNKIMRSVPQGDFEEAGHGLGELIGTFLKLAGVEKHPHNNRP